MYSFLFNTYSVFLRGQFGHSCCFQPTCSDYSRQAFRSHGFLLGFIFSAVRICRCHPFSKGGFDPVPVLKRGNLNER